MSIIHISKVVFFSYGHSDSNLNHAATPCNVRAVDGPYLTSLLGCKHECKWATQAIEVEEEGEKTNRERSSGISCGRIPHNTITHLLNLSRLNTVWASPEGRAEG